VRLFNYQNISGVVSILLLFATFSLAVLFTVCRRTVIYTAEQSKNILLGLLTFHTEGLIMLRLLCHELTTHSQSTT